MVAITFEQKIARDIIEEFGGDFADSLESVEEVRREIIDLSENPGAEVESNV